MWFHAPDRFNGATPLSPGDVGDSQDITPEIGITGTRVIDTKSKTLYIAANTKERRSALPLTCAGHRNRRGKIRRTGSALRFCARNSCRRHNRSIQRSMGESGARLAVIEWLCLLSA